MDVNVVTCSIKPQGELGGTAVGQTRYLLPPLNGSKVINIKVLSSTSANSNNKYRHSSCCGIKGILKLAEAEEACHPIASHGRV